MGSKCATLVPKMHARLVAATTSTCYSKYFWDDQVLNFHRLIVGQLKHKNGRIVSRQTQGREVDFDDHEVATDGPWSLRSERLTLPIRMV